MLLWVSLLSYTLHNVQHQFCSSVYSSIDNRSHRLPILTGVKRKEIRKVDMNGRQESWRVLHKWNHFIASFWVNLTKLDRVLHKFLSPLAPKRNSSVMFMINWKSYVIDNNWFSLPESGNCYFSVIQNALFESDFSTCPEGNRNKSYVAPCMRLDD